MSAVRALAALAVLAEAEAEFRVGLVLADDSIAAAIAMARAAAAGVRLQLQPDGEVEMRSARRPPQAVVDELRRHREAVRLLLAGEFPPDPPFPRYRVRGGGF